MKTDTCKSCGARIRWVLLPGGKKMPLDIQPNDRGNVAIHSDEQRAAVLTKEERLAHLGRVALYVSHFSTCPQGAQHRRAQ